MFVGKIVLVILMYKFFSDSPCSTPVDAVTRTPPIQGATPENKLTRASIGSPSGTGMDGVLTYLKCAICRRFVDENASTHMLQHMSSKK